MPSLATVERLRDRLVERVFLAHYHETVAGSALRELTRELLRQLPNGVSTDAVFESLRYLAGCELTPVECLQVSWRLAGNIKRLRAGLPAGPWGGQTEDEWVPLEVLSAVPGRNRKKDPGHTFAFRVLAGSPATLRITAFWSTKLSRYISRRVGFSAPWGKFAYPDPLALVRLRLYGLIIATRSATRPFFKQVSCPQSLQTWNRRHILRLRLRVLPCPNGWTHPCHKCAVGYRQCPAGTHRETYEQGPCNYCENPQALFDPERNREKCVTCDTRERMLIGG
jgi:hypothetical protein